MPVRKDELGDEEINQILNSKMVQKFLAYRELASGIEALKQDDVMYEQLLKGIEDRVRVKKKTVKSVLEAFVTEVETNTNALEKVEE